GHIVVGSFLILYTKGTVAALKGMFQNYPLSYLSAIPAVYGLLFLVSAMSTTHPWVFRIIALLAFGEAAVAFTDPRKIYSRMLNWYVGNISDQTNRLFGIIGIIFGTVMLTWI
ncbi:MAG: hypothetical protein V2I40_01010, partial [Desulfobacteraceae bacterium]|nr:hypothetical protein [Desulfobacteraceae bacterium]